MQPFKRYEFHCLTCTTQLVSVSQKFANVLIFDQRQWFRVCNSHPQQYSCRKGLVCISIRSNHVTTLPPRNSDQNKLLNLSFNSSYCVGKMRRCILPFALEKEYFVQTYKRTGKHKGTWQLNNLCVWFAACVCFHKILAITKTEVKKVYQA